MTGRIRPADPDRDAAAIAAIYRTVVEESHVSFEVVAPDEAEMAQRIRTTLALMPWLVVGEKGGVEGFAYAAPHRSRAAYRWSVDISVYVDISAQGRGLGRALYDVLIPVLRRQGFVNAYAGIALPNPASEALHRAVGMEPIGIYHGVGFKLGRWWDVAWYGMRLGDPPDLPADPLPVPALSDGPPS
jgi:L-amino acid N-acyltransferase YncA